VGLPPDRPSQFAHDGEVWLCDGRERDGSGQHGSLAFRQRLVQCIRDHA